MNTSDNCRIASDFGCGNSGGLLPAHLSSGAKSSPFGASNTNAFHYGSIPTSVPSTPGGFFENKSKGTSLGITQLSGTSSLTTSGPLNSNVGAPSSFLGGNVGTDSQVGGHFGPHPGIGSKSQTSNFAVLNGAIPNLASGLSDSLNTGANASSGQLFGNRSASSNTSSGGLFSNDGNAQTRINVDDSNPAKRSAGIFSASLEQNSQDNNTTSSLFGNSAIHASGASISKQGDSRLEGLINPSISNPSGIYGATHTSLINMFGEVPGRATGLFQGGKSVPVDVPEAQTSYNENPYVQNFVLGGITKPGQFMPQGITSAFLEKMRPLPNNPGRTPSSFALKASSPSIVSRLALTFNIFRTTTTLSPGSSSTNLHGIFTLQSHIDDINGTKKTELIVHDPAVIPFDFCGDRKNVGDYKRLVIKSSPSKFHLIDAELVFRAKRRRTVILTLPVREEYISNQALDAQSVLKLESTRRFLEGSDANSERNFEEKSLGHPLRDDGYFCSPSLLDLSVLTPHQLSEVNNFIVGRAGYGQISYIYPVDVSVLFEACDYDTTAVGDQIFGRIIQIENSIVRVYDDAGLKSPKMGSELNVPATITLKTPPKNRTIEDHIKRLQNMSGMEFVTYDPISSNWTFTVKHFSVWGLIDDSENEDDETENLNRLKSFKKKQKNKEAEATVVYSKLYQNDYYQNELKRQKIERQTSGIPGSWSFDTTTKPGGGALVVKQNLVQNEINHEVNAYMDKEFALALAANASDITNESDNEPVDNGQQKGYLDDLHFPANVRKSDYLKHIVKGMSLYADMNELVDEKAYEPEITSEKIFSKAGHVTTPTVSKNWLLELELSNNVDSALAPFAARPRKLQLALNSINDILFSDIGKRQNAFERPAMPRELTQGLPCLLERATTFDKASTVESFYNIILKSDIQDRENGFPQLKFARPLSFADVFSVFHKDSDSELLELASILFDKPDFSALPKYLGVDFGDSCLMERLEFLHQRENFFSWLRSYNKTIFDSHEKDPLNDVFYQVCSGDLKSAVAISANSNNLHLASLLTLLDSNDSTAKGIACSQLASWEESGELKFIPAVIVKVFKILSGDLNFFNSGVPTLVLLGLYVFYGNPSSRIETILEELPVKSDLGQLGEMLKIYSIWQAKNAQRTGDGIAESKLGNKLKWLLAQILPLKEPRECFVLLRDSVGLSLGNELVAAGLWKESIYVYSSMRDDAIVEHSIRKVVIDNASDIVENGVEQEDFLMNTLKVPRTLIFEAYAIDKRRKGDMWGSAEALMEANLWHEAHNIICDELGPMAIIEEHLDFIARLRELIASFPERGRIVLNWNQGAGFYARYFALLKADEEQGVIDSKEIGFLLDNMTHLEGNSFKQNASRKIVFKKIGDIALEHCDNKFSVSQKILAWNTGESEKSYLRTRVSYEGFLPS